MARTSKYAIQVTGLREAEDAFRALPEVYRKLLNVATETTARAVVAGAKARIVASPSIRTGALLNHVAFTMDTQKGRARVGIANGRVPALITSRGRRFKGVRASAFNRVMVNPSLYAHLVEFGTVKMSAEPFMLPAANAERQRYIDRCIEAHHQAERELAAIGKPEITL